jgi:hypothetical protein
MSAWRIGVGDARAGALAAAPSKPLKEQLLAALGALVKWLPAEVVAGYAATVTIMQPDQVEGAVPKPPSVSWAAWLVAFVATPIIVLFAAGAAGNLNKIVQRVVLSMPAFVLWSASVPYSAWNKVDAFKDNRPVFLLILLLVTTIFTYGAEWWTK